MGVVKLEVGDDPGIQFSQALKATVSFEVARDIKELIDGTAQDKTVALARLLSTVGTANFFTYQSMIEHLLVQPLDTNAANLALFATIRKENNWSYDDVVNGVSLKIAAIIAVRSRCGLGLKEAKGLVDGWIETEGPKPIRCDNQSPILGL